MGKLHFYVNTVTNLELSRVLGANKYPVKSKVSDIPQAVLSLYLYIKAKVDPRTLPFFCWLIFHDCHVKTPINKLQYRVNIVFFP